MNTLALTHPSKIVNATVALPASKSIANRLLLMRAIAGFADLEIENLSNARDTMILQNILAGLKTGSVIDVHDAGTVMRFLTAYLSSLEGEWTLTGSERMKERPIGTLVGVLRKLGADITYLEKENYPPLKIKGKKLKGGKIEIDGSVSSQFLSALLMIAPSYNEPLELQIRDELVSAPYVEMTLRLIQQWGIPYTWKDSTIKVENSQYIRPAGKIFVESDWSAASYFYSMLVLAKEGEIKIPHLFKTSLQGDSVCAQLFTQLGVSTVYSENEVRLKKTNISADRFMYDFINCPDLAQTFAVCCAAKGLAAELTGLQTLSIKETDRIAAIQAELGKFGIQVGATENSIKIPAQKISVSNLPVQTYKDHRMAMSFAPLALVCDKLEIEGPSVVDKSFPHFWEELKKSGFQIS